jgi:hypothetical protein
MQPTQMGDEKDIIATIKQLRQELGTIHEESRDSSVAFERLRRWKERAVEQLQILISEEEAARLAQKRMTSFSLRDPSGNYMREANLYDAHMETLQHELERNPSFIMKRKSEKQEVQPRNWMARIERLLSRFHVVARQMRSRYERRSTLEVQDEYDVQDLLHALLKTDFDDIRTEEWTPSYAGAASRMDFLLKEEQTVVEVKKTRATLKEKDIGSQLLVDVQRYRTHPDCKVLICFVYDPEGLIGNPRGLINDLQKQSTAELKVVVIINPM